MDSGLILQEDKNPKCVLILQYSLKKMEKIDIESK